MEFERDFDLEISDFGMQKIYSLSWDHGYGGTVACLPDIDEGVVYFGCDNYYLYALDVETGKEMWKFKAGDCAGNYSPIIGGDIVFFGSYDGYLYALGKKTGKLVWKFKTGGKVVSGVAHSDGKIVFGSRDFYVYCLDFEGIEIWRFRTGGEIISMPTIIDGNVYIGSYDGCMYCIDLGNGKEIWRFRTGGAVGNFGPVNIRGDMIFFGSWDFNMYCLNRHTGKEIWRVRAGRGIMTSGEIHDGVLYFGAKDGFHAVNISNGKELWIIKLGYNPHTSHVCVYEDKIYFGGGEDGYERGVLMCVDKRGKILWEFITNGPCWIGPQIKEGKLVTGSWNCYFYRLDTETGKVIWKFKTGGEPSKEKVIDHSEVALVTIITGEGIFEEKDREEKYSPTPEVQISDNVYVTKSEYSIGSKTYKAETGYK
ncbi:MAG: PQQ-binding-like beta-propeller repeat protein [Candidatus Aenigmatarchaeota archaeon]|nr:MAG: PQQ-binding-like beta-propeller repeat protein [Candidatus Aenigmarchaeota archaeon]